MLLIMLSICYRLLKEVFCLWSRDLLTLLASLVIHSMGGLGSLSGGGGSVKAGPA